MGETLADFFRRAGREDLLAQWDGPRTPRDLSASSREKVWWVCRKGHRWQA